MNYSGLLAQVHSQMVQPYAHAEMIWQSSSIIINLQTGNGAGVWMTLCSEEMVLRIWEFWKDSSWVFCCWGVRLSFLDLSQKRWIQILNTTRCATHWGWSQHSMVSIGFQDLRLSPHVAKDRNQKLIILFVSEMTECSCICITVVFYIFMAIQQLHDLK